MFTHTTSASSINKREEIQPLGMVGSLALFGLPAVILFVAFHAFRPWLESLGYDSLTSFLVALGLPLVLLFIAAFVG